MYPTLSSYAFVRLGSVSLWYFHCFMSCRAGTDRFPAFRHLCLLPPASWRFFDPVLRYWKEHTDAPLYGYPVGTWGPLESEAMMHEHGAEWTNPCKNLTNTDEYCEL